jgi:hypothetical protein
LFAKETDEEQKKKKRKEEEDEKGLRVLCALPEQGLRRIASPALVLVTCTDHPLGQAPASFI